MLFFEDLPGGFRISKVNSENHIYFVTESGTNMNELLLRVMKRQITDLQI